MTDGEVSRDHSCQQTSSCARLADKMSIMMIEEGAVHMVNPQFPQREGISHWTNTSCFTVRHRYTRTLSVEKSPTLCSHRNTHTHTHTHTHTDFEKDSAGNQISLRKYSATWPALLGISLFAPTFTYCEIFLPGINLPFYFLIF